MVRLIYAFASKKPPFALIYQEVPLTPWVIVQQVHHEHGYPGTIPRLGWLILRSTSKMLLFSLQITIVIPRCESR